jgi:Tfp pilus assembly protein PilF
VVLHDTLKPAEHNDLGVAYQAQGQLALAEREFKAAVRLDPHDARAWLNLGNVSAAQDRWARATSRFRRSLREDPRSADAMNNLAFALVQLPDARFDEAEALARAAVAAGGARDSVYRATLGEVRKARDARTPPARH